jgi:hypothetical protein
VSIPPPIHPFPARMAPELALDICRSLPRGARVLDPMTGSGTTLRAAIDSGHDAVGIDMDPLAVLLARAWTTPVSTNAFRARARSVADRVEEILPRPPAVDWIDDDPETLAFTEKWFGSKQRIQLRAFASVLAGHRGASWDLCRVALSRTIITKDRGASLARDVSHSRPHISYTASDYDVALAFLQAAELIARRLEAAPIRRRATVRLGDARAPKLPDGSIDAVITSPPYLNAIDYLRGHKLSLVWFGYAIRSLREIRGQEIGAERGLDAGSDSVERVLSAMGPVDVLPARKLNMCRRYAADILAFTAASAKALRLDGIAVFVIGNSAIAGRFLRNDAAIVEACVINGLRLQSRVERDLPPNRRYLPPPKNSPGQLNQRMRSEVVLTFATSTDS